IRIGAFGFTGKSKKELLWLAQLYFGHKSHRKYYPDLFAGEPENYQLPALRHYPLEDAFDELELLGFPLCDPFLLLKTEDTGDTLSDELMSKLGKTVTMTGYLITTKDTRT